MDVQHGFCLRVLEATSYAELDSTRKCIRGWVSAHPPVGLERPRTLASGKADLRNCRANPLSNQKTNPREPLEKLKTYPAFQNLRAKAETHQRQFRPKETTRLLQQGKLDQVLDSRTQSAWNALADCRRSGMHQNEAEEVALPNILLPSEKEEAQAEKERKEEMESW